MIYLICLCLVTFTKPTRYFKYNFICIALLKKTHFLAFIKINSKSILIFLKITRITTMNILILEILKSL